MIKSYVITIDEIDDGDDAVALVREKLAGINLLKNTFGIIVTHVEAFKSGVVSAVGDSLPFPCAGMAAIAMTSNGEIGTYLFSLTVLTSDDCWFSAGITPPVNFNGDVAPIVSETYLSLREQLNAPAEMAIMFCPFTRCHFPGEYIDAIAAVDSKVALFGGVVGVTIAENVVGEVATYCNGVQCDDSIVMILIGGNVRPKFFVSSFTDEAVMIKNMGVITKSRRNMLYEINDMKVGDFFDEQGLTLFKKDTGAGLLTSTLILDYGDSEKQKREVSRSLAAFNDEGLVCLGHIGEGAKVSLAVSTPESVRETAQEIVRRINEETKDMESATALSFTCIGRRFSLSVSQNSELDILKEELADNVNFFAAYVGGEICPVGACDGKSDNYEHNMTIVVCVF